jgi:hypothetical protein
MFVGNVFVGKVFVGKVLQLSLLLQGRAAGAPGRACVPVILLAPARLPH